MKVDDSKNNGNKEKDSSSKEKMEPPEKKEADPKEEPQKDKKSPQPKKDAPPPKPKDKGKGGGCCGCCKKKGDSTKSDKCCGCCSKKACCNKICIACWVILAIGLCLLLSLALDECFLQKYKTKPEDRAAITYNIIVAYCYLSLVLLFTILCIVLIKCGVKKMWLKYLAIVLLIIHILAGAIVGGFLYHIKRKARRKTISDTFCIKMSLVYVIIMLILGVIPFIILLLEHRKNRNQVVPQPEEASSTSVKSAPFRIRKEKHRSNQYRTNDHGPLNTLKHYKNGMNMRRSSPYRPSSPIVPSPPTVLVGSFRF